MIGIWRINCVKLTRNRHLEDNHNLYTTYMRKTSDGYRLAHIMFDRVFENRISFGKW